MTSSLFVDIRAKLNGRTYRPAGYFYAVDGTVYPGAPAPPQPIIDDGHGWWSGFSSGIVGGLTNLADGLWQSRCIGYPAATLPMWPSVQTGRANLVAAIRTDANVYQALHGTLEGFVIAGSGYSQGSMVWDQVYALDMLPDNGVLHDLLPYVYRIYQLGHIFRTPGIAHGNALAGLPESIEQDGVETGGIGLELDLTAEQTNRLAPDGRPIVHSCANKGDIYTCCSVGINPWSAPAAEGKVGRTFMKIVMQPTFSDVVAAAGVLGEPIAGVMELFHVMVFFAAGPNSPHYQYFPQMDACIDDAHKLGLSLPHELGV
ncbi:hypothetical protein [Mycolicibacter heraklionensis]|uniref:hypothetical protein n=1 Tax=Mycolicibacter heraklionensis TaxID=512402 RepID=UPI0006999CF1|nr:hypothetical protein [Mycolicibacter heraklionensis]